MANVSFYLDRRHVRPDGTAPIRLAIRFNYKTVMASTDIRITPDQWHPTLSRVVGHPRRKQLNSFLDTLRLDAEQGLRDLVASGETLTPDLVRSRILSRGKASNSRSSFINVFSRVSEDTRIKERTREIYRATLKKIILYADSLGIDPGTWKFEDITRSWLADFDAWLMDCSPSKNARNIHLRNIRHVCNVAVAEHITTFYDFRSFHIKAVPTAKRSLSVEKLRQLFSLDVEPYQRKYLDCFKLIFYLIGINTIDLCHLRKTDLVEGRIEYRRSKTGRNYSIRLEPEAEEIISRYAGKGEWLLDILDRYVNFKDFAHRLNENLQKMGEVEVGKHGKKTREPLFPNLTTYWARHSWATIAASLDIPNETIAAALGHSYGNRTTAIYIDFDTKKIDAANRKVIDWVLYGKK
ncbi:MAG: site-specific integrase [Prevotella sp.]|nr:site-specific integrase [Prevotella sp.]